MCDRQIISTTVVLGLLAVALRYDSVSAALFPQKRHTIRKQGRLLQGASSNITRQNDTTAAGDPFFLFDFEGFNLSTTLIEENCELESTILTVCIQAECRNFAEVCPSTTSSSKQEGGPSTEGYNCTSIQSTICDVYGEQEECCMKACALEFQNVVVCGGASNNNQNPLECGTPLCHTPTDNMTIASITDLPNLGEETNTTDNMTIASIADLPNLGEETITIADSPTTNPFQPALRPSMRPSIPELSSESTMKPTIEQSVEPEAITSTPSLGSIATSHPSDEPSTGEVTLSPTVMGTTSNSGIPPDSQQQPSPVAILPPLPGNSPPEAKDPTERRGQTYGQRVLITIFGPLGCTCFLLLLLYCSKPNETTGLQSRSSGEAPRPRGDQERWKPPVI